jgi:hypothetical protein
MILLPTLPKDQHFLALEDPGVVIEQNARLAEQAAAQSLDLP